MLWIPIIFICLSNGGCAFLQGNTVYTEAACKEQLLQASKQLQQDPNVVAFDGTCASVTPI